VTSHSSGAGTFNGFVPALVARLRRTGSVSFSCSSEELTADGDLLEACHNQDQDEQPNQSMKPTAKFAKQLQRVCHGTLPWLISVSLDRWKHLSRTTGLRLRFYSSC